MKQEIGKVTFKLFQSTKQDLWHCHRGRVDAELYVFLDFVPFLLPILLTVSFMFQQIRKTSKYSSTFCKNLSEADR